jgi:hypothetical protein
MIALGYLSINMATLILTTSCAPIKRPTDSSHGDSANEHTSSAAVGSEISGSGANVKNICFTTGHYADASQNGNHYGGKSCHVTSPVTDSSSIIRSNQQERNGDNKSHRESHRQRGRDVEFLQALPLQCDITIIPRAHPNDDDGAEYLPINATSLNSDGDFDAQSNGDDNQRMSIKPIRITKQRFHPCGIDNIVRLAGTTTMTSSSSRNDDNHDFILSLTNCGVHIDEDTMIQLPVQAVPSAFSFPKSSDTLYAYSSGGVKHGVEEVAVSFDFSIALDMYQQRLVATRAAAAAFDYNNQSWNEYGNAWEGKASSSSEDFPTTTTAIKTMEIKYIMSTLEEESQFIKKTLVVLGSFGFGLLICMVWTIWKLERGRRARRSSSSSRIVKKVFVDVPFEIIRATTNTATKSPEVGKDLFSEEISPIRSSVSLNEADKLTAAELSDKKGVHETLHLITPQVESNASNSKEGKSSSPRHWYEDFLSPRGCSKKKPSRNWSDTLFSEKEEVARSLFCSSSKNSNKVSPRIGFYNSKSAVSVLNAPKKKVFVPPIERSSSLPSPTSDVSLLKLSNDTESSKLSPLMISAETEETHVSPKTIDDDRDEPPSIIEVTQKEEESCTNSPVSIAITKESNVTDKSVGIQVNTPKPKRSMTLKTPCFPAADISISSQESQVSTSQKTRKSFAEELAKKAGLTPISTKSDFSTSIARRAAEVQTPKKTLRPLSVPSSPSDDEPSPFLADYW